MGSFVFLGLWVLVVGVAFLALWLNWVARAWVRAGVIGASLGVVGASLWQSPTLLDALLALGLFTGLALIIVGDGRLAALPDVEPHSATEWTDDAIGTLSGTRGRFDEFAIKFGVACCASALLVAVFQVASLPSRLVAAVPDAPRPTETATPYRRLPQAATPSVTPTATATPTPAPAPTITSTLVDPPAYSVGRRIRKRFGCRPALRPCHRCPRKM